MNKINKQYFAWLRQITPLVYDNAKSIYEVLSEIIVVLLELKDNQNDFSTEMDSHYKNLQDKKQELIKRMTDYSNLFKDNLNLYRELYNSKKKDIKDTIEDIVNRYLAKYQEKLDTIKDTYDTKTKDIEDSIKAIVDNYNNFFTTTTTDFDEYVNDKINDFFNLATEYVTKMHEYINSEKSRLAQEINDNWDSTKLEKYQTDITNYVNECFNDLMMRITFFNIETELQNLNIDEKTKLAFLPNLNLFSSLYNQGFIQRVSDHLVTEGKLTYYSSSATNTYGLTNNVFKNSNFPTQTDVDIVGVGHVDNIYLNNLGIEPPGNIEYSGVGEVANVVYLGIANGWHFILYNMKGKDAGGLSNQYEDRLIKFNATGQTNYLLYNFTQTQDPSYYWPQQGCYVDYDKDNDTYYFYGTHGYRYGTFTLKDELITYLNDNATTNSCVFLGYAPRTKKLVEVFSTNNAITSKTYDTSWHENSGYAFENDPTKIKIAKINENATSSSPTSASNRNYDYFLGKSIRNNNIDYLLISCSPYLMEATHEQHQCVRCSSFDRIPYSSYLKGEYYKTFDFFFNNVTSKLTYWQFTSTLLSTYLQLDLDCYPLDYDYFWTKDDVYFYESFTGSARVPSQQASYRVLKNNLNLDDYDVVIDYTLGQIYWVKDKNMTSTADIPKFYKLEYKAHYEPLINYLGTNFETKFNLRMQYNYPFTETDKVKISWNETENKFNIVTTDLQQNENFNLCHFDFNTNDIFNNFSKNFKQNYVYILNFANGVLPSGYGYIVQFNNDSLYTEDFQNNLYILNNNGMYQYFDLSINKLSDGEQLNGSYGVSFKEAETLLDALPYYLCQTQNLTNFTHYYDSVVDEYTINAIQSNNDNEIVLYHESTPYLKRLTKYKLTLKSITNPPNNEYLNINEDSVLLPRKDETVDIYFNYNDMLKISFSGNINPAFINYKYQIVSIEEIKSIQEQMALAIPTHDAITDATLDYDRATSIFTIKGSGSFTYYFSLKTDLKGIKINYEIINNNGTLPEVRFGYSNGSTELSNNKWSVQNVDTKNQISITMWGETDITFKLTIEEISSPNDVIGPILNEILMKLPEANPEYYEFADDHLVVKSEIGVATTLVGVPTQTIFENSGLSPNQYFNPNITNEKFTFQSENDPNSSIFNNLDTWENFVRRIPLLVVVPRDSWTNLQEGDILTFEVTV